MGFLAGELEMVLTAHQPPTDASAWVILYRMGVHPQQVERLQAAAGDFGLVATLPMHIFPRLRQEVGITPEESCRLHAGVEADAFLQLMQYHHYPLEECANKANTVFALHLKNKLAMGGMSASEYPALGGTLGVGLLPRAVVTPTKKRGRKPKDKTAPAPASTPAAILTAT